MLQPRIVTRAEWLLARRAHLAKEKELTRLRDEVTRGGRALPWVKVDKEYVFDGPNGPETLADLFEGRNQLIVYHFMFRPDWEYGCPSCSYVADHIDPTIIHLAHRDVTFRVVSRAPIDQIEAFRNRMGWKFHWVSSFRNEFNYDYNVSFPPERIVDGTIMYNFTTVEVGSEVPLDEREGISVFSKGADGAIYHTYSTYERGVDLFVGTYNWLDIVPKGRDEDGLAFKMAWLRHHDRYDDKYRVDEVSGYPFPPRIAHSCCEATT